MPMHMPNACELLSRPQVDACVLAFLRNRGNWNTQAYTGRIVVDYAAHSKNIRVSEQLGTLGRQRIHVSGVARGGPGGHGPPQTFGKCFFSAMNFGKYAVNVFFLQ